ncbi:MAG: type II toxin-antitoxin system VapC family toxin [Terrimicrobiaceae bacterium]
MLLLDTSFLVDFEAEIAGNKIGPARRLLHSRAREPVAISIVSLGEFAEGFENFHDVEAFLSRFRVIPLSRSIAYKAAAMQSHLPQRLGENDAWIAATALAYEAELAGRERAFGRVPRLKYTAISFPV